MSSGEAGRAGSAGPGEGVALAGGRTTGARLVAGTIRKPCVASTPAVHAVLDYLSSAGFEGAPRPYRLDGRGQVLSFLSGDTVGDRLPWPAWTWSDVLLVDVGRWLRRMHDLTASFVPPPDAVWATGHAWRPGLIIGHQDAAPWNAVAHRGRLVGFVDWDTAAPSSRERDLAFTALTWVPLLAPPFAAALGFSAGDQRSRRLHRLLDAYGYQGDRRQFAQDVTARAELQAAMIRRVADQRGDPVHTSMLPWIAELDAAAVHIRTLPSSFWVRLPEPACAHDEGSGVAGPRP